MRSETLTGSGLLDELPTDWVNSELLETFRVSAPFNFTTFAPPIGLIRNYWKRKDSLDWSGGQTSLGPTDWVNSELLETGWGLLITGVITNPTDWVNSELLETIGAVDIARAIQVTPPIGLIRNYWKRQTLAAATDRSVACPTDWVNSELLETQCRRRR